MFHDYFTFAANNQTCSCALNLPFSIGQVTSVELLEAGTNIPVATFNFASNANASFGGGLNWQGFSASAVAAAGNTPVDLAFHVQPTQFQCDERRRQLAMAGLNPKAAGFEFSEMVANALRDPAGGVVVGTGGADREGNPNHHVSVQPPGPVEIAFFDADRACLADAQLPCTVDLQTGRMSESCFTTPGLEIASQPTDSNGDGWLEASIGLNPTGEFASKVCVVLDYSQEPRGMTVNIGDAGFAGPGSKIGGSTGRSVVEILNSTMTTWRAGKNDRLAVHELALDNGAYKVCIGEQSVTFGQGAGRSMIPLGQDLFAGSGPFGEGLVIGLNPPLSSAGGSSSTVPGTGLRRAHITIE